MILTMVLANVADIPNIDEYHIETALVKSDDLTKRILRVTSDHNREYGIRLDGKSALLEHGSAFEVGDHQLLVLSVIPDRMLVVHPRDIDEMGVLAHFVGNMHKPVQIQDGTITLLYDPVVEQAFSDKGVVYEVSEDQLTEPLRYVDMTGYGAAHDAAHAAMDAEQGHHHKHHHGHPHDHDSHHNHGHHPKVHHG